MIYIYIYMNLVLISLNLGFKRKPGSIWLVPRIVMVPLLILFLINFIREFLAKARNLMKSGSKIWIIFHRISSCQVEPCGASVCDGMGPVDCLWDPWQDWCLPSSASLKPMWVHDFHPQLVGGDWNMDSIFPFSWEFLHPN